MNNRIIFSITVDYDDYTFHEDGTYFWNRAHDERFWKIDDNKLYWQSRVALREGTGFSRFFSEDCEDADTFLIEEQRIIDGISRAIMHNTILKEA